MKPINYRIRLCFRRSVIERTEQIYDGNENKLNGHCEEDGSTRSLTNETKIILTAVIYRASIVSSTLSLH